MTIYFDHERLDVYRFAKEVAEVIPKRRYEHADLKRQAVRASQSVVLNIAEGCCRVGKDRNHLFRIAYGSAAETSSTLDLVDWPDREEQQEKLRRVGVMLNRMANG